ncbi:MAG: hypothetical protein GTN81_11205 [Proteobacteria bacterium]|nr:hypothetical protein [Pseudomonadota bacterium]
MGDDQEVTIYFEKRPLKSPSEKSNRSGIGGQWTQDFLPNSAAGGLELSDRIDRRG